MEAPFKLGVLEGFVPETPLDTEERERELEPDTDTGAHNISWLAELVFNESEA